LGPPPSRACDNCLASSDLSRAVDSLWSFQLLYRVSNKYIVAKIGFFSN
jgi:hypothetical protein